VWGGLPGTDEKDVAVVRVTELKPQGVLDVSTAAHRSISTRQFAARQLRDGDLLLEKSGGGPNSPVGRVGLVAAPLVDSVCSNFMQLMRPDPTVMLPRFLHLYLNHIHDAGDTVAMQTSSTNIRNIKTKEYLGVPVPVPSLDQQRRVVSLLEEHLASMDASRNAFLEAARRLGTLRSSALEHLFGIGNSNPTPLRTYVRVISAGKSYCASAAPAGPDEWGIIKVSAMTRGEFRATENKAVPASRADPRFQIRAGDLLVSRANTAEYVGACVLVPEDVRPRLLLSDKSLRIEPNDSVSPEWLWRALQTPTARRQISHLATGTKNSMRNISQGALLGVELPLVSDAKQQSAVIGYRHLQESLKRMETSVHSMQARATALRRATLTAAFSGRLTGSESDTDVVEVVEEEAS
jgi:type I restriction enzyme S subunit